MSLPSLRLPRHWLQVKKFLAAASKLGDTAASNVAVITVPLNDSVRSCASTMCHVLLPLALFRTSQPHANMRELRWPHVFCWPRRGSSDLVLPKPVSDYTGLGDWVSTAPPRRAQVASLKASVAEALFDGGVLEQKLIRMESVPYRADGWAGNQIVILSMTTAD